MVGPNETADDAGSSVVQEIVALVSVIAATEMPLIVGGVVSGIGGAPEPLRTLK